MKGICSVSAFLLIVVVNSIFAQQSPQPYGYNFGTILPNPPTCNDNCTASGYFSGVLSDAGTFSAGSDNGAVSANSNGPLFSYVNDNNIINGSGLSFLLRAAETESGGNRFVIDKFGKYGTATNETYESNTAMMAFKFKLGNDNAVTTSKDGDIIFVLGQSSPGFSTGGVPTLSLNNQNTFLAIRFQMIDGIVSTYAYSSGNWVPIILPVPVQLGQTNVVEIYANNANTGTTRPAGNYGINMNNQSWYLRINGVGQTYSQIGSLGVGQTINSFMVLGFNSPNNSFYMYMDDIKYSTTSATPAALPVSLKSFQVNNQVNSNKINWTTSSEVNNKGFEVQRAIGNANDFKTIGFVGTRAKDGNSQIEISYSFEDADVKAGQTHYYRLNQIDFDGKSTLSPVRSVKPGSIESNLNVYPNPSQGSVTVNTGSTSGKLNIYVLDNTGRTVNQYMNVSTSNTRISNLKKGLYTLKIVNTETGEQSAQRVVVQ